MIARALLPALLLAPALAAAPLRVGVTLPAYYSWVRQLTDGLPPGSVEVLRLAPIDGAHGSQPDPADVRRLREVDLLVANGLGHDLWLPRLRRAAGREGLEEVDLHAGVPLLPGAGEGAGPNSHTFVSLTGAVQQIHNLERALAARLPGQAEALRQATRALTRRLRALRGLTARSLEGHRAPVATVHGGYDYLLQELGVEVAVVIESRHGVPPSAGELAAAASRIRESGAKVLLDEAGPRRRFVATLAEAAGVPVASVEHTGMAWEPGAFEAALRRNCRAVLRALGATEP